MTRPIYDSEQLAAAGAGMTPERAKVHCIISLVLRYGAPVLFYIAVLANLDGFFLSSIVCMLLVHLMLIAPYFASWCFMIGVRCHNKDSLFGKFLMVLYILETAAVILCCYISFVSFFKAMH